MIVYSKHGCDYKGYGLASRLPRLDLSAFTKETLEDRRRPIVQQFCVICQSPENNKETKLIPCDGGCSRAYHQDCYSISITENKFWYCSSQCLENKQKNKVGKYYLTSLFYYHLALYSLSFSRGFTKKIFTFDEITTTATKNLCCQTAKTNRQKMYKKGLSLVLKNIVIKKKIL